MYTRFKRMTGVLLLLTLLLGLVILPASADGTNIIGEVTITHNRAVNLRSGGGTEYSIVGSANPGELFQTTGTTSSGWYEILLPNGQVAYVSNTLVYFYPYTQSVPAGTQYNLPVYYKNPQGTTIKTVQVPVRVGQNVVTADDSQMPGYRLTSARSVYVSVDQAGRASPGGVIFTYELTSLPQNPGGVTASLPIYYRNAYNQLLASELRTLNIGTQLVRADTSKLPAGYSISGTADAVVTVSYNGIPSPASLTFTASLSSYTPPQQASVSLPISYRDELGNTLHNTSQVLARGYTTITANDALVPAGYTLTSQRSVSVFLSDAGISYPGGVVFTYKKAVQAVIQITYKDQNNPSGSLHTETRTLPEGSNTVTANDTKVPSGYTLQSARNVQVTVYNNGYVSQNQVVFTYAPPAPQTVTVAIPVVYKDWPGNVLYNTYAYVSTGTNTVTANDAFVPNYGLHSARNQTVTVDRYGNATPNSITFTYILKQSAQPTPAVTAVIPVVYKDFPGNVLHTTEFYARYGSNTVTANDSLVPNYALHSARNQTVNVDQYGNANPTSITFTYILRDAAPPAQPQQGNVDGVPILPGHQTFSYSGDPIAVYTGPGTYFYRSGNGRATVAGGRLRVWGTRGDWALIGYGLSNNLYRVGYIPRSAVPYDLNLPELQFSSKMATVTSTAYLTDDPIVKPTWITEIPVGTQVYLLAYETFANHWAYVETTYNGQQIVGFINKARISVP